MMKDYSWQHPDWPNYVYDVSASQDNLYLYATAAGRISGGMAQLNASLQYEAYIDFMVSEAITTSRIEGELLDREDVRSSIKNQLGFSQPLPKANDPKAIGISGLMIDVRHSFQESLTPQTLFKWHELVMADDPYRLLKPDVEIGKWRTTADDMVVASGAIGREVIHYQAPPSDRVALEMEQFLTWYNNTNPLNPDQKKLISGPVRAAIAHLWFETIHPFGDGNGRVGRAIAEQALAQDLNHPPLLSLSTVIERNRKTYYQELNKASGFDLDISDWVHYFCNTVLEAQQEAFQKVDHILKKAKFWGQYKYIALNDRQTKVVNKVFKAGPEGFEYGISAKKYMAMAQCSKATATRDLTELLNKGCVKKLAGGGRNTRYELNLGGNVTKFEF